MKKSYLLLPLLLLGGCAMMNEDMDDESYYDEDIAIEEDAFYEEDPNDVPVQEAPAQPAPIARPTPQQPVTQSGQASVSPDGTVIELPAQQIYIGNPAQPPMPPVPAVRSYPQPQRGLLSFSQPIQTCPNAQVYQGQIQPQPQPAYITLQNRDYPNTYVQCLSTDLNCLTLYRQQGYVRVQDLPHFAGYQDVPDRSDYPGNGRWRNQNNIPRW